MGGENHRKQIGFGMVVLVCALIITATFTWNDISQHKTNRFNTTDVRYNVVLVEEFNPNEAKHWFKDESIEKKLSVRNGQDGDDRETYAFEDAYIRIQLKEYFAINKINYIYSDKRYMVDLDGNFIKELTQEAVTDWMSANGIDDDTRVEQVKGFYDDVEYYYIATKYGDVNGEYGKFLVVDVETTESVSLVPGQSNQSADAETNHHAETNKEDEYFVHKWSETNFQLAHADENSPFSEYIKWNLGDDIITLESWIQSGAEATKKWILDTSSEEGWVYWGERLVHNNTVTDIDSVTTSFFKSITLLKQPDGIADYFIHANLDAVGVQDIGLWTDAPVEIISALKDWKPRLRDLVTKTEQKDLTGYTTESVDHLTSILNGSKELLENAEATQLEFELAYSNLNSEIINLVLLPEAEPQP